MTCFLGHRFCIDFGGVWGGVWDPKIVAFRIFFDVFSMSKSKCVLEREKIAQKIEKSKLFRFLAPGLRCRGGPGEREKERGVRILAEEFRRRISRSYRRCRLTVQHAVAHQGGAADWKPPGGGHRRPPIADNPRPNVAGIWKFKGLKASRDSARSWQILAFV